jgi:hypothetical protein
VIKTIRMLAPGLEDCQHQCFKEDKCVSYNLGPVFGVIRSCELSDTDHVEYPDDVKSVPGAKYCGIKVSSSQFINRHLVMFEGTSFFKCICISIPFFSFFYTQVF